MRLSFLWLVFVAGCSSGIEFEPAPLPEHLEVSVAHDVALLLSVGVGDDREPQRFDDHQRRLARLHRVDGLVRVEWLEHSARPGLEAGVEPGDLESLRLAQGLAGPDALQRALWRTHLSVGERAPGLESALREMAQTLPGTPRVSVCSVMLEAATDAVAVFSTRLDLESRSGPVTLQSALGGTLEVRRSDGLPLALALEGPTTVTSDGASRGAPTIIGGGTLGVTRRLRSLADAPEQLVAR